MQNSKNNYLLKGEPHDVYLANPLGFTESGRQMLQKNILPKFTKGGVKVYEPFREFYDKVISLYGTFDLNNKEIVSFGAYSNAMAIKNSKLVIAVLDGVDVDSGTASEIGYASAIGKPIFGVRTDFRGNSAESSVIKVNLQVEGFIEMSGGKIFEKYSEAIKNTIKYIIENPE